jgi:aromatic ring-opening dioxygenase catalytic subunit (LigB family)
MEIVGAFACSHAGLIATRRERAPRAQERQIYGAFASAARDIAGLRPDALLIIATDHMRAFPLASVPTFTVGVGPVARGLGDGGLTPCEVPVHQVLSRSLLATAIADGFDVCFTEDVRIDHSFVMPLLALTPALDVPISPVTINCNVPPRPTYERVYSFGATLRRGIDALPGGRVVVLATGGLSHWVGSDERRALMNRPPGTRLAALGQISMGLSDTGPINEEFDRSVLAAVARGELATLLADWPPERLEEEAGNGAHELRNWLVLSGLMGDAPGEVLAYEPVSEWLTGTAVVRFPAPNPA